MSWAMPRAVCELTMVVCVNVWFVGPDQSSRECSQEEELFLIAANVVSMFTRTYDIYAEANAFNRSCV